MFDLDPFSILEDGSKIKIAFILFTKNKLHVWKKYIASHNISSSMGMQDGIIFLINFEYHNIELSPYFTL